MPVKKIVYELDVDTLKAVASYEGMFSQVKDLVTEIHKADELASEEKIAKMGDLQKALINAQYQQNINSIKSQLDQAEKLLRQRYDNELKMIDRNDKEARQRIQARWEMEQRVINERREGIGLEPSREPKKMLGQDVSKMEGVAAVGGMVLAAIGLIERLPAQFERFTKNVTGIDIHAANIIPGLGAISSLTDLQKFINTDLMPTYRSLVEISMATGEKIDFLGETSQESKEALAKMSDDALVNSRVMNISTQDYLSVVGTLRREGMMSLSQTATSAMEVIGIAKMTGQSVQEVASGVADLVMKWNVPQQEATRTYLGLMEDAKKAGMPLKDFHQNAESVDQSLARFGYTIQQAGGLVSQFGTDIEKHRISLGELISMFTQATETPAGPQVMMLQRLADSPALQGMAPKLFEAMTRAGVIGDAMRMRGFGIEAAGGGMGGAIQSEYRKLLVGSVNEMMGGLGATDRFARTGFRSPLMNLFGLGVVGGAPVMQWEDMLKTLERGTGWVGAAPQSDVNSLLNLAKITQTQLSDANRVVDTQRRAGLIQAAKKNLEIMRSRLGISAGGEVGMLPAGAELWGVPGLAPPTPGISPEQTPEEMIRGMETQFAAYAGRMEKEMGKGFFGLDEVKIETGRAIIEASTVMINPAFGGMFGGGGKRTAPKAPRPKGQGE